MRRRLVLASVAAGLGVAVLLGLGTWQIQRAAWKDGLQAALDARLALPPAELPATLATPDDWHQRRAVARGVFDHARAVTVLRPAADGRSGYHVVTPLIRAGAPAVLVDRGWVPLDRSDPATRAEGLVEGPVVVDGIAALPAGPGPLTPANDPASGAWYWVDPSAIAAAAGVEALPVVLEAGPAPVPGGWPEGGQTVTRLRNEHRGYAATWYALAAALAVVYVVFVRGERRKVAR